MLETTKIARLCQMVWRIKADAVISWKCPIRIGETAFTMSSNHHWLDVKA